ncbi:Izumo sperm-egg fusion protein 1 [Merluccius polli]|uniref:Izumo sperm-egg fusion protein 1 n=1 Tax=Merluccius polli TaxID=89951 RepID=A0AA47MQE9_MERPO|nr:Izumo sperm-egg fusion protein 1 [Merluccius polli]
MVVDRKIKNNIIFLNTLVSGSDSLKGHAEDDRPGLVADDEAVFVEVQQLSLQQLGFTQGGRVVAPGDDGSQHQHAAQHARHHQGPTVPTELLLQRGATDPHTGGLVHLTSWYDLRFLRSEKCKGDGPRKGLQGSRRAPGSEGADRAGFLGRHLQKGTTHSNKAMQPQLLAVVSLWALCPGPAVRACLQCDRKTRLLHEDLLLSAASVEDQIEFTLIRDHAYVTYRETSQARRGVIDPTTLYRASTQYHNEFDRFKKIHQTELGTFEAIQIMEKGRKILEEHLDMFIRQGQLYQRVIDCSSCKYRFYNCSSPTHQLDCGEHHVEAEAGGHAVLNCFLPWHSLVQGRPEYHFTWAPGPPGTKQLKESDFQTLVVTEEPSVVLNQLHVDEQGTYRCSLQDRNPTVFSTLTFLLSGKAERRGGNVLQVQNILSVAQLSTKKKCPVLFEVTVVPTQTPAQPIAWPTLPAPRYTFQMSPPTRHLLLIIIATVTAFSLVASIGHTVALGLTMKRKTRERRARQTVSVY